MKKAFLFALAAFCAFAAQAVTIDWTTQQSEITTSGTFSVALKVILTPADINTNKAFLIVKNALENPTIYAGVGASNAASDGRVWINNTSTFWSRGDIKVGENIFGIVFARNATSDDQLRSLTVSYYINGTWVDSSDPNTYWSTGQATTDLNIIEHEGGTLYFANGAATAADFASVPEPTALALLALGVAGLALKRKVA